MLIKRATDNAMIDSNVSGMHGHKHVQYICLPSVTKTSEYLHCLWAERARLEAVFTASVHSKRQNPRPYFPDRIPLYICVALEAQFITYAVIQNLFGIPS